METFETAPRTLTEQFIDKNKSEVVSETYSAIKQVLDKELVTGLIGSEQTATGKVFEMVALEERVRKSETPEQRTVRLIIESIWRSSKVILETKEPSKPDLVSVVFDKNGMLQIDRIVEFKMSHSVRKLSLKKKQPEKSLRTMADIVDIMNQLISGKNPEDIKSGKNTTDKVGRKRLKLLQHLKQRIDEANIKQPINFSKDLKYTYILPEDYKYAKFGNREIRSKKLGLVTCTTETSKFSRKDIESIIDHYAENP